MIPRLVDIPGAPWATLPPGIHAASMQEAEQTFAVNPARRRLFKGFRDGVALLVAAGCRLVYLDGSFATAKPSPGDFDALWDPSEVDPRKLDPILLDFSNGRHNQKVRFGGEFFPSTLTADVSGNAFTDFFQIEKYTGERKGILAIQIGAEENKTGRRTNDPQ